MRAVVIYYIIKTLSILAYLAATIFGLYFFLTPIIAAYGWTLFLSVWGILFVIGFCSSWIFIMTRKPFIPQATHKEIYDA